MFVNYVLHDKDAICLNKTHQRFILNWSDKNIQITKNKYPDDIEWTGAQWEN